MLQWRHRNMKILTKNQLWNKIDKNGRYFKGSVHTGPFYLLSFGIAIMLNILWNKLAYCIKCTSLVWSIWQWQWRWRRWWWLYCCTEPWQTGSTLTTARAWPFEVSHFKDKYYNVLQSGLTYLRCCYCKSPRQSSEVVFYLFRLMQRSEPMSSWIAPRHNVHLGS